MIGTTTTSTTTNTKSSSLSTSTTTTTTTTMGTIIQHLVGIINASVELYLANIIAPFLKLHEIFYGELNRVLRELIHKKEPLPYWFTANFITYLRTWTIIPCLILLSWGHRALPSIIIILVDFGDFLDGVVARYWMDVNKAKAVEAAKKKKREKKKTTTTTTTTTAGVDEGSGDDDEHSSSSSSGGSSKSSEDGFHVVSTKSSKVIPSWIVTHRNSTYGGFIDAICDKAFMIPCWIALLSRVPQTPLAFVQYTTLILLSLLETGSGSIRFRAYYTSGGVSTPKVVNGLDFSSSAVKADHVGKAKQTFEMVGTACFVLPYVKYFGLILLSAAVPLAYESVRRKIVSRVIYVNGSSSSSSSNAAGGGGGVAGGLNYKTLKFWTQAKGMGSCLVVGITNNTTEQNVGGGGSAGGTGDHHHHEEQGDGGSGSSSGGGGGGDKKEKDENKIVTKKNKHNTKTDNDVLNACAVNCVDNVIVAAPKTIDLRFMKNYGIDYIVVPSSSSSSSSTTSPNKNYNDKNEGKGTPTAPGTDISWVHEDVIECCKCLVIEDDGDDDDDGIAGSGGAIAYPLKSKHLFGSSSFSGSKPLLSNKKKD